MPRTEPFDKYSIDYEKWFEEHEYVYKSELKAVGHFIPKDKKGIEIGIGSCRFAIPFNIKVGVEPSIAMRNYSIKHGLKVYDGIAENLPLKDASYEFALMVTTICFIDDVRKAFLEINRILKSGGSFIIGFIDKTSLIGKKYERLKQNNKFYRFATFYSVDDVVNYLKETNFKNIRIIQTIFGNLSEIKEVQKFREGYGEGSFAVIKADI